MLELSYLKLKKYAYCVLGLPFIVFAFGWMKWYWAIPATIATVLCVFLGGFRIQKNEGKTTETEKDRIRIKKWMLVLLIAIGLVWVWQSGIGGFWAQSKDYPWRNAIYRDIVLRDWPVYYDLYDGALVYYIGFWLVPALFGKLALFLGANDVTAFQVASVAIFIWAAILIVILFALLVTLLKANTVKKQLLILLGFVFFSGLDILGSIEPLGANFYHLEWWADHYQYSSFTTCMFWVFNQSIIPWITFACLLQERTIRNYVFLGMMCLFSGPLPFVGFFLFCITLGIIKCVEAVKDKQIKVFLKDIISVSNVLSTVFIFIFIAAYLLSNAAISGGGALRLDQGATIIQSEADSSGTVITGASLENLLTYLKFVMFEFGFYVLLIGRKTYKNPLFYVMTASLLVFPFIKIGGGADFPMRASIPSLFYLYYLVMKFIMEEKHWMRQKGTVNRLLYIVLLVVFLLGSFTPAVEFYRGCRQVVKSGLDNPMEDYLYTLGGDGPNAWTVESGYEYGNFVSVHPNEQLFFRYFAGELQGK